MPVFLTLAWHYKKKLTKKGNNSYMEVLRMSSRVSGNLAWRVSGNHSDIIPTSNAGVPITSSGKASFRLPPTNKP